MKIYLDKDVNLEYTRRKRRQHDISILALTTLSIAVLSAVTHPTPGFANEFQCHSHQGWQDSDGDAIPDIIETEADFDNDGTPNYLDHDSDNDGIPDLQEGGVEPPSGLDINSNNIDDLYEVLPTLAGDIDHDPEGDGIANSKLPVDTDNDGMPDYLDTDSDNDGLTDQIETQSDTSGLLTDTDEDGLTDLEENQLGTNPLNRDSDGGGIPDTIELLLGSNPLVSLDDHLHLGNLDPDSDGVPNHLDGHGDADGDGLPNCVDIDSDNDGWFDIREAGLPDIDNNGIADDLADWNDNGLAEALEGLLLFITDSDNDSIVDTQDADADNDTLPDKDEIGNPLIALALGTDPFDIDQDGLPNNVDLDSDNDGINDIDEANREHLDFDKNGIGDVMNDSDIDGVPDSSDIDYHENTGDMDDDGDGIRNTHDADYNDTSGAAPDPNEESTPETITPGDTTAAAESIIIIELSDTDGDGILNEFDPDADGDGLADIHSTLPTTILDSDNDGIGDLHDSTNNTPDQIPPIDASALETIDSNLLVLRPVETWNPCSLVQPGPETTVVDFGALSGTPLTNIPIAESVDENTEPGIGAANPEENALDSKSGGSGSISWYWLLVAFFVRRRPVTRR